MIYYYIKEKNEFLKLPSRDTVIRRMSIETEKELMRIREVIANELGIPLEEVKRKDAESVFRLKASRGKVKIDEIRDILLGKLAV